MERARGGPGPGADAADAPRGGHRVSDGLLLRSDLHRLFDRGYLTVTPDHRVRVSGALREELDNGRSYSGLDGARIHLPPDREDRPDRELLAWHGEAVFRAA